jgi:hypothetical protein
VSTRSGSQIRSHAQKFFLKSKEQLAADDNASADQPEEHEDNTVNSKPISDTGIQHEDMSFYLSKMYASYDLVLNIQEQRKILIFGRDWWI